MKKAPTFFRKILYLLLVLTLVTSTFSLFPVKVFAATNDATIEVLGGGGGGGFISGSAGGGGGGGGEYRRCTETLSVQSYTVTVGTGGTADTANKTDSSFSGTGISITAIGGLGTTNGNAGTGGTGGTSTNCDTAVANFNGGTPGAGSNSNDVGGGGGGGAGYGGKGGNSSDANSTAGEGGGGGAGESGAGGDTTTASAGSAGSGGGGAGGIGVTTTYAATSNGTAGTPATYHIVGGGGGGGGDDGTRGGSCGTPGGGSGGGDIAGAGNGCRGEVRIIYVDSEVDATGGTETTSGIFRIHTFTTSGTFTVNSVTLPTPPTVSTDFPSNVSGTVGTINGTKTGGDDATEHGFAWGTLSGLNGGDTATTTLGAKTSNTTFSSILSLSQNTTYYYRAYGTNTGGTGYGIIRSFYSGNSNIVRKILLFQGFKIKFNNGKILINQK